MIVRKNGKSDHCNFHAEGFHPKFNLISHLTKKPPTSAYKPDYFIFIYNISLSKKKYEIFIQQGW